MNSKNKLVASAQPVETIKRSDIAKHVADTLGLQEPSRTPIMKRVRSVVKAKLEEGDIFPLADINHWLATYPWHDQHRKETEHGKLIKHAFAKYIISKSVTVYLEGLQEPLKVMNGEMGDAFHSYDPRALHEIENLRRLLHEETEKLRNATEMRELAEEQTQREIKKREVAETSSLHAQNRNGVLQEEFEKLKQEYENVKAKLKHHESKITD